MPPLFRVVFGTAAAAAGAAALNQWWERQADALMNRTRMRPVPAGRMRPAEALCNRLGALDLWSWVSALACNALSAVLAAITIAIYIFAYTPLKRVSTANTVVGAIPGAIPPMIGWAAAGAHSMQAPGASSRFFFYGNCRISSPSPGCIAKIIREPGFRMISSDDPPANAAPAKVCFFCILLLVLAGLPGFVGVVNLRLSRRSSWCLAAFCCRCDALS